MAHEMGGFPVKQATWCDLCSLQIPNGVQAHRCRSCGFECHSSCLPDVRGLACPAKAPRIPISPQNPNSVQPGFQQPSPPQRMAAPKKPQEPSNSTGRQISSRQERKNSAHGSRGKRRSSLNSNQSAEDLEGLKSKHEKAEDVAKRAEEQARQTEEQLRREMEIKEKEEQLNKKEAELERKEKELIAREKERKRLVAEFETQRLKEEAERKEFEKKRLEEEDKKKEQEKKKKEEERKKQDEDRKQRIMARVKAGEGDNIGCPDHHAESASEAGKEAGDDHKEHKIRELATQRRAREMAEEKRRKEEERKQREEEQKKLRDAMLVEIRHKLKQIKTEEPDIREDLICLENIEFSEMIAQERQEAVAAKELELQRAEERRRELLRALERERKQKEAEARARKLAEKQKAAEDEVQRLRIKKEAIRLSLVNAKKPSERNEESMMDTTPLSQRTSLRLQLPLSPMSMWGANEHPSAKKKLEMGCNEKLEASAPLGSPIRDTNPLTARDCSPKKTHFLLKMSPKPPPMFRNIEEAAVADKMNLDRSVEELRMQVRANADALGGTVPSSPIIAWENWSSNTLFGNTNPASPEKYLSGPGCGKVFGQPKEDQRFHVPATLGPAPLPPHGIKSTPQIALDVTDPVEVSLQVLKSFDRAIAKRRELQRQYEAEKTAYQAVKNELVEEKKSHAEMKERHFQQLAKLAKLEKIQYNMERIQEREELRQMHMDQLRGADRDVLCGTKSILQAMWEREGRDERLMDMEWRFRLEQHLHSLQAIGGSDEFYLALKQHQKQVQAQMKLDEERRQLERQEARKLMKHQTHVTASQKKMLEADSAENGKSKQAALAQKLAKKYAQHVPKPIL